MQELPLSSVSRILLFLRVNKGMLRMARWAVVVLGWIVTIPVTISSTLLSIG